LGSGFKHGDGMTLITQIISTGKARWTGPDNGDFLACICFFFRNIVPHIAKVLIGRVAFELTDSDRLFHDLTPAFLFTEGGADSADR